jgi:hypothetical protein
MRFVAVLAASAVLWAGHAQAADLSKIFVTGTLTEETSLGDPVNFGVASIVTVKATFDPKTVVVWGDTGYKIVGLFNNGSFSLELGGHTYSFRDEILDGDRFFYDYSDSAATNALPAIIFKDGKVAGLVGQINPSRSIAAPLNLGSAISAGVRDQCRADDGSYLPQLCSYFGPLYLSDGFKVLRQEYYGNSYSGPNFTGTWNFSASLAPVPEPATWAMIVLGIGAIGGAVRRSQSAARVISA